MNRYTNINSSAKCIWIYELYYYPNKTHVPDTEIVFYRGTVDNINSETLRNCEVRLKEHQAAAKNETNTEAKYEYARNKILNKGWDFSIRIVHEYNEGDAWSHEFSEHWWVIDAVRKGYPIQNMKHGDLQDPFYVDQIEDLSIQTEEEYIADTKRRRKLEIIDVDKAWDTWLRLNERSMHLRAKLTTQDVNLENKIDDKKNTLACLKADENMLVKAIEGLKTERDVIYNNIKQEVLGDHAPQILELEKVEARIKQATGFEKSYRRIETLEYHSGELKRVAKTVEELNVEITDGCLNSISRYMDSIELYKADMETATDLSIMNSILHLKKMRGYAWSAFYHLKKMNEVDK